MEEATWPQVFPNRGIYPLLLLIGNTLSVPSKTKLQTILRTWWWGVIFWDKGKEMLRAEKEGVRNSSFLQMENKPKKLDQKKKGVGGGRAA